MRPDVDGVLNLLGMENVSGVCARAITEMNADLMELKLRAKEREIPVNTFESSMQWS